MNNLFIYLTFKFQYGFYRIHNIEEEGSSSNR